MKKKGSALVMAVVIAAVLIILSLSVLSISASSLKNNSSYDRINQVRLLAESGIEQAIGQLVNGTSMTVNDIVSSDGYITCKVTVSLSTRFVSDTYTKYYTVVSTATGGSGKYSKTIDIDFKKVISNGTTVGGTPSQVSDLVNNYIIKNAVTLFVTSDADKVFTWPSSSGNSANNIITVYGNLYFGGNNINFTPTEFYLHGNVVIEGDSYLVNATKTSKQVIDGTVTQASTLPPDIRPVIDPNTVNKVVFYTNGTSSLLGYTANSSSNLYTIDSKIKNSTYSSYYSNSSVYKVVIVDGDLTIDNFYKNTYNNYLIYCTGKVIIDGNNSNNGSNLVTLVNTVICANKGLKFLQKINLTIDNRVGIPVTAGKVISDYLSQGLTDPTNGTIVRWQE